MLARMLHILTNYGLIRVRVRLKTRWLRYRVRVKPRWTYYAYRNIAAVDCYRFSTYYHWNKNPASLSSLSL